MRETWRMEEGSSQLKTEVFQGEEKRMSDKTLWFMLWVTGGHSTNAPENSFGSVPVTHPTESSPGTLHVFIYVNYSRAVIIHELYPVWTFEAIKLVSSVSVTGMRNSIPQHTQPDERTGTRRLLFFFFFKGSFFGA